MPQLDLDYTDLDRELKKLGLDPHDKNLTYQSSDLCLDGSRTMNVYLDGKHVVSAFVPNREPDFRDNY